MSFLAFILCVLTAFMAVADEMKYGGFILNADIPDPLFFVDEIKANNALAFKLDHPMEAGQ